MTSRHAQIEAMGLAAYPHMYETNFKYADFIKHNDIENGAKLKETDFKLVGRVLLKREASKKLYFFTLLVDGNEVQVCSNLGDYVNAVGEVVDKDSDEFKYNRNIGMGDIVGFSGFVGKTDKSGALIIFSRSGQILAPCLEIIPKEHFGVADPEIRFSKRYLDLITSPIVRNIFKTRSKIIRVMRNILDDEDFMEVETPILGTSYGGANAKPFKTYLNDLKKDMFMRIAPELYLKQLVIGGFNKVFEIGKQFRNESIDSSHAPEFSSIEIYWSPADYNNMMSLCEKLFSQIVFAIHGKFQVTYTLEGKDVELDFTPPFKRIDILDKLREKTGYAFINLDTEQTRTELLDICVKNNIKFPPPYTTPRILDKLIGEYVEVECIQPTFLMHHPIIMSPLAKPHRNDPTLSERFEMFVCCKELANAYTELNSPFIQRDNFIKQMMDKNGGDEEAQIPDDEFVTALQFGLPCTGGLGIGIDRLIMYLTNQNNIREVQLFNIRTA
jgi:lysyl-tRNA synthetase class 2